MSTSIAQIEANRRNAQSSTGPRTPEGRAAASANSTKFGLFATHLAVRPAEAPAYEEMRSRFLAELRPHGVLEESLALQIVNANWRLHRCDLAESAIPVTNPDEPVHDFGNPAQKAIERARVAAQNTIRRSSHDLKELQAERWRRATLKLTGPIDPVELGLAPIKEAMSAIPTESQRNFLLIRSRMLQNEPDPAPEPLAQNEPKSAFASKTGRNENCPCGSGQKYKRCCGHWSNAA